MKKITRITVILIIISIIMSMSVLAVQPRANLYIMTDYASIVRKENNDVKIEFSITCTGPMTMLGASTIKLYTSDDTLVKTFKYADYPEMMGYSDTSYTSSVTYQGSSSEKYYAIVTFLAENNSGGGVDYYTTATQ